MKHINESIRGGRSYSSPTQFYAVFAEGPVNDLKKYNPDCVLDDRGWKWFIMTTDDLRKFFSENHLGLSIRVFRITQPLREFKENIGYLKTQTILSVLKNNELSESQFK